MNALFLSLVMSACPCEPCKCGVDCPCEVTFAAAQCEGGSCRVPAAKAESGHKAAKSGHKHRRHFRPLRLFRGLRLFRCKGC